MQHHVKQEPPYFQSLVGSVYEYRIDGNWTCWVQFTGAYRIVYKKPQLKEEKTDFVSFLVMQLLVDWQTRRDGRNQDAIARYTDRRILQTVIFANVPFHTKNKLDKYCHYYCWTLDSPADENRKKPRSAVKSWNVRQHYSHQSEPKIYKILCILKQLRSLFKFSSYFN